MTASLTTKLLALLPQSKSFRAIVLWPLTILYRFGLTLHQAVYKYGLKVKHRLPGKTISIGNIVVGGTGKSPVTTAIGRYLLQHGKRVIILTRGYKSGLDSRSHLFLQSGRIIGGSYNQDQPYMLDEPMMLSNELPDATIIVGRDRVNAARSFIHHTNFDEAAMTWLLDDGFQHWALYRDLDIALLDATVPFGNGLLLPAGILREPSYSLKRSDFILVTRAAQGVQPEAILQNLGIGNATFAVASFSTSELRQVAGPVSSNKSIASWGLVLGIAWPERVEKTIAGLGYCVNSRYIVGDHEGFAAEQLREMSKRVEAIITTSKDYWRNPKVFDLDIPVFILPLIVELPDQLLEKLAVV